jgi:hypothetical protein
MRMSESGFTWGDYVSWRARAKAAEERVAELEKAAERAEAFAFERNKRVAELERALRQIMNELGVPNSGYPAPVANAYEIAERAFSGETPE